MLFAVSIVSREEDFVFELGNESLAELPEGGRKSLKEEMVPIIVGYLKGILLLLLGDLSLRGSEV